MPDTVSIRQSGKGTEMDRITRNAVKIFNASGITGLDVMDPADALRVVENYYRAEGMLSGMNPNYLTAVAKRMRSLVIQQASGKGA